MVSYFFKFFSLTLTSSLIFAVSQWGIISAISRFDSVDAVGIYAFALSLVVPINMFFNFGVRQLICTEQTAVRVEDYIVSILCSQFFGLFICLIISYLMYPEYLIPVLFLYITKICESTSETVYGNHQRTDNYRDIAISKIIRSFVLLLSIVIPLYLNFNLNIALFIQSLFSIFAIFIIDIRKINFRHLVIQFDKIYSLGFPLGIAGILLSFKTMYPRFLMEHYSTTYELGIFASLLYFVSAGGLIITAFSQILIPKVASANDNQTRRKMLVIGLLGTLFIGLSGALFLIFIGPAIFSLIYGSDFQVDVKFVNYIAIIFILNFISSYLGYMSSALRVLKQQPIIYLFILCIMTIHFYLFKNYYPVVDVTYITVIFGFIVQILLLALLVNKGCKK